MASKRTLKRSRSDLEFVSSVMDKAPPKKKAKLSVNRAESDIERVWDHVLLLIIVGFIKNNIKPLVIPNDIIQTINMFCPTFKWISILSGSMINEIKPHFTTEHCW